MIPSGYGGRVWTMMLEIVCPEHACDSSRLSLADITATLLSFAS
ncbi:MAG: hypothetical protein ACRENI_12875 [Gemmatimonadaceae bacterium]